MLSMSNKGKRSWNDNSWFIWEKIMKMDSICDIMIKVPSDNTPRIQESHIMIGHIICELIEEELF